MGGLKVERIEDDDRSLTESIFRIRMALEYNFILLPWIEDYNDARVAGDHESAKIISEFIAHMVASLIESKEALSVPDIDEDERYFIYGRKDRQTLQDFTRDSGCSDSIGSNFKEAMTNWLSQSAEHLVPNNAGSGDLGHLAVFRDLSVDIRNVQKAGIGGIVPEEWQ